MRQGRGRSKMVLIAIWCGYGLLAAALVLLKLSGVLHWPWMVIFTPLWIAGGLALLFSMMVAFLFLTDVGPPGDV